MRMWNLQKTIPQYVVHKMLFIEAHNNIDLASRRYFYKANNVTENQYQIVFQKLAVWALRAFQNMLCKQKVYVKLLLSMTSPKPKIRSQLSVCIQRHAFCH